MITNPVRFKHKKTDNSFIVKAKTTLFRSIPFVLAIAAGIGMAYFYWLVSDLPAVSALEEYRPAESSKIYSEEGVLLGEFYTEKRTYVPLHELPPHVKDALIAIEDTRFYEHHGVDITGILRALQANIKARAVVQGGSTITQQLAKMLFLKPERTLQRKLKEAILAMHIEKKYTKDEILELYLNQAFFGAGTYGIESASWAFFGTSARHLSIAQAALLAGIPKAPSIYNPRKNPDRAKERMKLVLNRMYELGYINKEQMKEARQEQITLPSLHALNAPFFYEYLRGVLEPGYGEQLYTGGLQIHTTINAYMQRIAEGVVADGINRIEKRVSPGVEAALIAMDAKNGNILAMVGGKNFWESQFNRATQAVRQPGSAFKPFVYLAALQRGYEPDDIVLDELRVYRDDLGKIWVPGNYDNKYRGPVTLKTALAKSLNSVAVHLIDEVGVDTVISLAKDMGITSKLHPYLPLALGSSGVTLVELVQAYSVFATFGNKYDASVYSVVVDRNDQVIERTRLHKKRIIDKKVAQNMNTLLQAVVQEGTAKSARSLNIPFLAGKTGTTNDYIDAWFIGYTDRVVLGVWVGRDDNTPVGPKETGSRAALPIWMDFIKRVYKNPQ
jgi:penicillin-binding protein 1A